MKDVPTEGQPSPVAAVAVTADRPTQGGCRLRWPWAEPSVWTERMLSALENGVKGGVWFSLVDKVYSGRALASAWEGVKSNRGAGGVDRQTVEQFSRGEAGRLRTLSEALRTGRYQPQPVRRVYIPKPDGRRRPMGIPTVRDRIVQTALRNVLEPIFEKEFVDGSYGFRPGRSAKDALRRVDHLLKSGYGYVVDADIQSYFDTIPHEPLMRQMATRVADGKVLALVRSFLTQGVMEGMTQWTPLAGSPQGAVISPLLSNIYLHPLDVKMEEQGFAMIRYADDLVVLCRDREQATRALQTITDWMSQAGLTLHPDKTRLVDVAAGDGFDFLGYRFERGERVPRDKSLQKFKDAIRQRTRRTNGQSLDAIMATINPIIRGWFAYFKHSGWWVFRNLDRWIRMRLRSILRKRRKRRGRGRGADHQRWPNAFFVSRGLFTMLRAYEHIRQSVTAH